MINKAFEVSVGENDKSVDSFLEEWKKDFQENQPLTPTEFLSLKILNIKVLILKEFGHNTMPKKNRNIRTTTTVEIYHI